MGLCVFCYFSRICGINLPKANTTCKFSELLYDDDDDLLDYINSSHNRFIEPSYPVLFTKDILETANKIKSNLTVVLRGPKGCGKSFATIVLFIYLQKKTPCLYLSFCSFDNSYTESYFLNFLEKCKVKLKDNENLPNLSDRGELLSKNVVKLIKYFSRNQYLYLFVDFANMASYKQRPQALDALMDCVSVISAGKLKKIISVSSGISKIKNKRSFLEWLEESKAARLYEIVCGSWEVAHITGFTSEEVDTFVRAKIGNDTNLELEEIKAIGGVNPRLLSRIDKSDDIFKYSSKVTDEMEEFLRENLHLKKELNSVKEFLELQNWDGCQKFIYYACRGEKLCLIY